MASATETHATPRQNIVKVILQGGPSQIDLWDPKPHAVSDVRGTFGTISTRIPGIQISECLPQIANAMHHFTVVRSVTGSIGSHDLTQATTGLSSVHASAFQTRFQTRSVLATSFSHVRTLLDSQVNDVVLPFGQWDHHRHLKPALALQANALDTELTRFIRWLSHSGLLLSTTILVWGEFGRSPRRNAHGGRDHWPAVNSALIAGGPEGRGNVCGTTSDDGSHIVDEAISMSDVLRRCVRDVALVP